MMAWLQQNWEIIAMLAGAMALGVVSVLILKSKMAQKAEVSTKAMAAHVKAAVVAHIHKTPTVDPDIASAVANAPAAPVASGAANPPAVAPNAPSATGPSAGSGGTAQVVVTHADRVLAKHAQLDKRIADGKAAEQEKEALNAAQAQLDKLTEAA